MKCTVYRRIKVVSVCQRSYQLANICMLNIDEYLNLIFRYRGIYKLIGPITDRKTWNLGIVRIFRIHNRLGTTARETKRKNIW